MSTGNMRLLNVLVAKEARGELTERQVEKLNALRAELRPVLVKEAIAAALQYEKEAVAAGPRRSKRLAGKPRVSYEGLDDEEVADEAAEAEAEVVAEVAGPRRSSRLAAKPRVSYADPSVGQQRYEAAVAALLALRTAGV